MSVTEKIFIDALSMPAQERATLVHKLLVSLEPSAGSPEIDAAWKQEAVERCEAFDAGELAERDASEVLKDAYGRLK